VHLRLQGKQESLANAKVSARQQCVYEGPYDEIYDKSTEGTCGLQLCRYLHSFSCCCVPNLRIPAKFEENSNLLQGHSRSLISILDVNRKRIYNFLLVINSNCGRISYSYRDINAFNSKIACFFPPHLCLTPPGGGTPCNIYVIYIPLKRTFNGLQFCRGHYGDIRLAAVGSQIREFTRNFGQNLTLQQFKVIQCQRFRCQSKEHM